LARGTVVGLEISVAAECKRYARAIGIGAVDQFVGKLLDLGAERGGSTPTRASRQLPFVGPSDLPARMSFWLPWTVRKLFRPPHTTPTIGLGDRSIRCGLMTLTPRNTSASYRPASGGRRDPNYRAGCRAAFAACQRVGTAEERPHPAPQPVRNADALYFVALTGRLCHSRARSDGQRRY
jgi:hypothetical protein